LEYALKKTMKTEDGIEILPFRDFSRLLASGEL